jgi:UDP-N-acetylglucosamine acyltransferase
MTATIHPTAIIDPNAKIGANVRIGPYCTIGADVVLGDGCTLASHVVITGHTTLGEQCSIFPFASLGQPPQDLKYRGEQSRLEIGSRVNIREYVTINTGTEGGGLLTKIGDDCLLMVGVHVAHDCRVGNRVVMANNATLAGHVTVGDHAVIGGLAAVHQFVRIGTHAMIGGLTGVEHDVIPYGLVMGERGYLQGLNLVGLKRHNYSRDEMNALRTVYNKLFDGHGTVQQKLEHLQALSQSPAVSQLLSFISSESPRSLCMPRISNGRSSGSNGAASAVAAA